MSSMYGRKSSSLHAKARTAGRYVLALCGGCLITLAGVLVLVTADNLVNPVEVTNG